MRCLHNTQWHTHIQSGLLDEDWVRETQQIWTMRKVLVRSNLLRLLKLLRLNKDELNEKGGTTSSS